MEFENNQLQLEGQRLGAGEHRRDPRLEPRTGQLTAAGQGPRLH
jgi:hypothetical protein